MSEAQQAEPQRHSAFFTLSLLIDSEQMNALLDACWPHAVWDQKLLEDVQRQHAESSELSAAINPMFDDIADRRERRPLQLQRLLGRHLHRRA